MICSCHCGALRFRGAFFYPLKNGGAFLMLTIKPQNYIHG
nr:MAG TPA: Glutathione-dependent formaldehyde-activating enzyme [Caudoviricetes sp.]